jgi:hypothetical protein
VIAAHGRMIAYGRAYVDVPIRRGLRATDEQRCPTTASGLIQSTLCM